MTDLKLVANETNETEDDDSWAEITDGKLVKFDNAQCRKLAAAFDSGNREPGNEVAKLCVLLLDTLAFDIDEYVHEDYIKNFSVGMKQDHNEH